MRIILAAALLACVGVVNAQYTYEYEGKPFDEIRLDSATYIFSTTDKVTLSITLADRLAEDHCGYVFPTQFVSSAGPVTITEANASSWLFELCLVDGVLEEWRVLVNFFADEDIQLGQIEGDYNLNIVSQRFGNVLRPSGAGLQQRDTGSFVTCGVPCQLLLFDFGTIAGDSGTWTSPPPPTPEEQLEDLAALVVEINLQAGISNSLDSKLDATMSALDDANANNDTAAINSLYGFCNNVEAQRGKKLTDEQAEQLIEGANGIISSLDENASLCQ